MKQSIPLTLAAILIPASLIKGDTYEWSDGAGNNNWISSGNWSQNPGSGDYPGKNIGAHIVLLDGRNWGSGGTNHFDIDLTTASSSDSFTINVLDISTDGSTDFWKLQEGPQSSELTIENDLISNLAGGGKAEIYPDIILTGNPVDWTTSGNKLILHGALKGTSSRSLRPFNSNGGGLTLKSAGDFQGDIRIENNTLDLDHVNAVREARIELSSNATLEYINNTNLGALIGSGNLALGSGNLNIGTKNSDNSYSGNIGGTGTLTKVGTGAWTISGSGTHTGTFNIDSGSIKLNSDLALQHSNVSINTDNGLNLNGRSNVTLGAITNVGDLDLGTTNLTLQNGTDSYHLGIISGTGSLTINKSGGLQSLLKDNTYSGGTFLLGGTLLCDDQGDLGDVSGALTMGNATFKINTSHSQSRALLFSAPSTTAIMEIDNGVTLNWNGSINDIDTSQTLNKKGPGTLSITNDTNAFGGDLDIDSGNVSISASSMEHATVRLGVDNGLTLTTANTTIGALAGSGNLQLSENLTVGGNSRNATYSGDLSQAGVKSLTKAGTGSWTLRGTSTRNGKSIIEAGSIVIDNPTHSPLGTGVLTVKAGAKLSGDGIVGSPVTVEASGEVRTPASGGTLSMAGLTLGGKYRATVTDSGALSRINCDHSLTLTGSTLQIHLPNGAPTAPAYVLMSYGKVGGAISSLTGTFSSIVNLPEGYLIDYAHNDGSSNRNIALVVDTTPPTITGFTLDNSLSSPTNADTILFNLTFDEEVIGVDATDFSISFPGTHGTPTISGSGSSYTLGIPNVSGDGTLTATLPISGHGITDIKLNPLTLLITPLSPVEIDNTAPTVSGFTADTASPTKSHAVKFTVTFDEPVTNFNNAADLNISTTGSISFVNASVSGSGDTYTVTLTGLSGEGTAAIQVKAGITDALGNASPSPSGTSASITIDREAPNATSITTTTPSPTDAETVIYTIVFDEVVTDFNSIDDLNFVTTGTMVFTDAIFSTSDHITHTVTLNGVWGDGTMALAVVTGNKVKDTTGNNLASSVTSTPITHFNDPTPIHYVNAANPNPEPPYDTWTTAAATLQDALRHTSPDDQVWIAKGVYYPDEGGTQTNDDREAVFNIPAGALVYGGFSGNGTETENTDRDPEIHLTILSGDIGQNDVNTDGNFINEFHEESLPQGHSTSSKQLVKVDGSGSTSLLDGLVFTGVKAELLNEAPVVFTNGSSLLVHDCLFSGNGSSSGLLQGSASATCTIRKCTFKGNQGHIVQTVAAASITEDCQFLLSHQNEGIRIFQFSEGSQATISRCSFDSVVRDIHDSAGKDYSQEILFASGSDTTINHCLFTGNVLTNFNQLIGSDSGSALKLSNSVFSGNTGTQLCSLVAASNGIAPSAITNCTFTGNSFTDSPIILTNGNFGSSPLVIQNSIFWNNRNDNGLNHSSVAYQDFDNTTTESFSHCIVGGSTGSGATWPASLGADGGGNLDTNPFFVTGIDPATAPTSTAGDLRLSSGSPALDSGDNTADLDGSGTGITTIADIATDLSGNARITDGTVDIGTLEGSVSPYKLWTEAMKLTPGVNDAPTDDPDLDGCPNLKEFAFDGNPLAGSEEKKFRTETKELADQDHLILTLPIRTGAIFTGTPSPTASTAGLTYTIQGTEDLLSYHEVLLEIPTTNSASLPPLSPGWEYRSFRFDKSSALQSQAFFRIAITPTP